LFVPVLNIKEKELRLKTEITFLLKCLNIQTQNLVFRDHFSSEYFSNVKNLSVSLVDHHVLLRYAILVFLSCHVINTKLYKI